MRIGHILATIRVNINGLDHPISQFCPTINFIYYNIDSNIPSPYQRGGLQETREMNRNNGIATAISHPCDNAGSTGIRRRFGRNTTLTGRYI